MTLSRTLLASAALLASLLAPAVPGLAQTAVQETAGTSSALPLVEGEVRKIDMAAGKITLKHGDIPNLDMPAMTMVFQVRDKTRLDTLKVGDQVRFRADKVLGAEGENNGCLVPLLLP